MAKRGGFPGGMPGNMNNIMKQAQQVVEPLKLQFQVQRKLQKLNLIRKL